MTTYTFCQFHLDSAERRLYAPDGDQLHVRPKTFAVLLHLVQNAGEVVSRQELLEGVWGGRAVSQDVVRVSVHEARRLLDDTDRSIIETVARRGFRLRAEIGTVATSRPLEPTRPGLDESFRSEIGYPELRNRIHTAWDRVAADRRSELILLRGEAGIGKSTLLDGVACAAEKCAFVLRAECRELDARSGSFLPLQTSLESLAGETARAVDRAISLKAPSWRLLLDRRSAPAGETPPTTGRLARELEDVLAQLGESRPVLLLLDDAQWADEGTLAVLAALGRTSRRLPVLALAAIRHPIDGEAPLSAWIEPTLGSPRVHDGRLTGFGPREVVEWLEQHPIAKAASLPMSLAGRLYELSGGRPLFLSILLSQIGDASADGLTEEPGSLYQGIPGAASNRLRAVVEARLASLGGPARRMLEAAALLAETHSLFDSKLLAAVAGEEESICEATLASLDEWGCFLERSDRRISRSLSRTSLPTWDGLYRFRHEFFLDVVAGTINQARRRDLHARVATTLEAGPAGEPRDIAHHWQRARQLERELTARVDACSTATLGQRRTEALEHARRGLELLDLQTSPDLGVELELRRLELRSSVLVEGIACQNTMAGIQSLVALAEAQDNPILLVILLPILGHCHCMRGEYASALTLSERLRALGESFQNESLIAESYSIEAHVALQSGRIERAISCGEKALLGPEIVQLPGSDDRQEPHIGQHACLSYALALLGDLPSARVHTAWLERRVADTPTHPGALLAAQLLAHHHQLVGDFDAMHLVASQHLEAADEYGFRDCALSLRLLAGVGSDALAVARSEHILDELESSGVRTHSSFHLVTLARRALAGGRPEEVRRLVERAEDLGDETGEIVLRPELRRLEACALFEADDRTGAAAHLHRSLELAREAGARLLELRTATTVAALAERGLTGVVEEPSRELEEALQPFAGERCPDAEAARSLLGPRSPGAPHRLTAPPVAPDSTTRPSATERVCAELEPQ